MQHFKSNGKLMISGEYVVLHGAKALAIPLKKGQTLKVSNKPNQGLSWKANHSKGIWFEVDFNSNLDIIGTSNFQMAKKLKEILLQALKLSQQNVSFLSEKNIITKLDFDPQWGWGSSSTLISNLAQWLNINPYTLLEQTFGGSGYDVAAAQASNPFFYERSNDFSSPRITETTFNPPFLSQIWVVYLNEKQSSAEAINNDSIKKTPDAELINRISEIGMEMSSNHSKENFMELMTEHESLISNYTGFMPVKKQLFPDFPGALKSLGAWGGDFIMALSYLSDNETKSFFQTKGHEVLFKLENLKLDNNNEG